MIDALPALISYGHGWPYKYALTVHALSRSAIMSFLD